MGGRKEGRKEGRKNALEFAKEEIIYLVIKGY